MIGLLFMSFIATQVPDAASSPLPTISPELQARFDDFLKDPASAQIRIDSDRVLSLAGTTEHVICGRYNAKNSYGGYVGFKDFVYRSSNRTLYTDGTAVRPTGTDSLDEIMTHNPNTRAELDALGAKGDAIIAEVHSALDLCES